MIPTFLILAALIAVAFWSLGYLTGQRGPDPMDPDVPNLVDVAPTLHLEPERPWWLPRPTGGRFVPARTPELRRLSAAITDWRNAS